MNRLIEMRERSAWAMRAAFALGSVLLVLSAQMACGSSRSTDMQPPAASTEEEPLALQTFDFGGDFELTSDSGAPFRLADQRGKVVLLFFGYTYCPDICPTTVATMGKVERLLGADSEKVLPLFVSVDPERDSIERLREYVGNFQTHFVAATGTKTQVDAVVSKYAAFYEKQASDSAMGYLVDHTSRLYLIDQQGRIRYLFRYGETPETIAKGVRLALGQS